MLAELRFISFEDLMKFESAGCNLGGQPDCRQVPGLEASTGSLGHGMPIAVGMAMGLRIEQESRRVVTLIGVGEANEGSIWEAAMLVAHHKLGNRLFGDFRGIREWTEVHVPGGWRARRPKRLGVLGWSAIPVTTPQRLPFLHVERCRGIRDRLDDRGRVEAPAPARFLGTSCGFQRSPPPCHEIPGRTGKSDVFN